VSRAELRIESLAAGGDGVAHLPDGRVVFVPFTAPGDLVRVRLVETRARFARGRVEEILEAGPARATPVCPVFGSCGGCTWQHVDYAAQLDAKRRILRDAIRRIGGMDEPELGRVLPSPSEYAYRGRTRVRVERGRVGYLRRRSHALCAVSRCPVLVPVLDRRLHEIAAHPPQAQGEWELASGSDEVRACPLGTPGAPRIRLEVGDHRIAVSSGVFAQSNALMLETLVTRVGDAAGRGVLAVELYAGAGLLTVGLAKRFDSVVAVEGDPVAIGDLRANLAEAALDRVEVVAQSVERALPGLAGRSPAVLVLDPPRSGLEPRSADALVAVRAERIVYLSCDPATLARDLAAICAQGYRLQALEGIDLFPQTPHVEALATLERRPSAPRGPGNASEARSEPTRGFALGAASGEGSPRPLRRNVLTPG
jgi:23S rRNA (uracil1939-C5)-methyltransferase